VPKGSTVIFNVWGIMRDPRVWERPDEFLPERFLDEAAGVEFRGKDFEFTRTLGAALPRRSYSGQCFLLDS